MKKLGRPPIAYLVGGFWAPPVPPLPCADNAGAEEVLWGWARTRFLSGCSWSAFPSLYEEWAIRLGNISKVHGSPGHNSHSCVQNESSSVSVSVFIEAYKGQCQEHFYYFFPASGLHCKASVQS